MKEHWAKAILVLFGVAAVAVLAARPFQGSTPREPSYRQIPLHVWVAELETRNTPEAKAAIRALGRRAVPTLIRLAGEGEWPQPGPVSALALLSSSATADLIGAMEDPDPKVRWTALRAIARFTPKLKIPPETLIPPLIERLHDPNQGIQLAALLVLDQMGTNRVRAVSALSRLLRDPEPDPNEWSDSIRQFSARELGAVGAHAQEAVPVLVPLLSDPDPCTRQQAAIALWQITGKPDLVLPELSRMLQDTNLATRILASAALSRIGQRAPLEPELAAEVQIVQSQVRPGKGVVGIGTP